VSQLPASRVCRAGPAAAAAVSAAAAVGMGGGIIGDAGEVPNRLGVELVGGV
jgi:hypothetical protein